MTNKPWDSNRDILRRLLRELRESEAGLTQKALSQQLQKPQSYVSKYETGERKLDYVEVVEICKVIGVSIHDFNRLYEQRTLHIGRVKPAGTL